MAKIKLDSEEIIRLSADVRNDVFIDVICHKNELGISIEFRPYSQYVEIREKNGVCRQFIFEKKGHKKYYDFGYWADAKVVFSINEVLKK